MPFEAIRPYNTVQQSQAFYYNGNLRNACQKYAFPFRHYTCLLYTLISCLPVNTKLTYIANMCNAGTETHIFGMRFGGCRCSKRPAIAEQYYKV